MLQVAQKTGKLFCGRSVPVCCSVFRPLPNNATFSARPGHFSFRQTRQVWDQGTWAPTCNLALMYFGMGDNDTAVKFLRRGARVRRAALLALESTDFFSCRLIN
jgi:hypothetical protein